MLKIGLTGSIGTGKSFIANLFEQHHILLLDSDACVKDIYQNDQAFFDFVATEFPEAVNSGEINRTRLGDIVFSDPTKLALLESYLHPKLKKIRDTFLKKNATAEMIVFDIPLLFEKQLETQMDVVICTYCEAALQKARVLKRSHITTAYYSKILAQQLPQEVKVTQADFTINTNGSKFWSFIEFKKVLKNIRHLHLL